MDPSRPGLPSETEPPNTTEATGITAEIAKINHRGNLLQLVALQAQMCVGVV